MTRSLLPLADNLAWRRLWLDKVLLRDSCKTNTKQPHHMTYYPLQENELISTENLMKWKVLKILIWTERVQYFSFHKVLSFKIYQKVQKPLIWNVQDFEKATRAGKKSFYTHFAPPHFCAMLTKHFHLTQVYILPFLILIDTCWHLFCRYYDYDFMFLAFSNTICPRL